MKIIKKIKGASLIELMIGLTIGTLVGIATYSTSMFFTKEARSGNSMNNVFQEGMNGMYLIGHDLRQAGLGSGANNLLACSTINAYYNGAVISDGAIAAPVIITNGGTTGPDSLTLRYSNSVVGGGSAQVLSAMPTSSSIVKANTGATFNVGDIIVLANPGSSTPCTLMSITHIANTGFGTDLQHNPTGAYNPSNPNSVFTNAPGYPAGSIVLNYGRYVWRKYSVVNNTLNLQDILSSVNYPLIGNVVDLQAQYGVTNGTTNDLTGWVEPTGQWDATVLDENHIKRIRAVHLSMLLRSPQKIKPAVTGVCDATMALPVTWTNGPAFNTPSNADWKCYKYRSLNVVVPLKNIIYTFN